MINSFLLFMLLLFSISNKMITIPYSISTSQTVTVKISFTNNYNYPDISLQSPLSYLIINPESLTKKGTEIFIINDKPFELILCQEDILIQGYKTKLNFYGGIVNRTEKFNFIYSHLSFGLGEISKSTSFIYQLYNRKEIDRLIFGIYPFCSESGEIYIGDIPNHLIKNKPHGECLAYNNSWSCSITMLKFINKYEGTTSYILSQYMVALFSTEQVKISCSLELFEYFLNYIFKEAMDNNLCWIMYSNNLYCPSSLEGTKNRLFRLLPTHLELVFDNMTLSLPFLHLFSQEGTFIFQSDKNLKSNEIRLGYSFLKNYLTIFDYDKKSISFYFPDEDKFFIIGNNTKENDIRALLILIIISLLSLCSILLIYKK